MCGHMERCPHGWFDPTEALCRKDIENNEGFYKQVKT